MATGQHPYQTLCVKSEELKTGPRNFLFGACGPNIFSVSLVIGLIRSKWSTEDTQSSVSHNSALDHISPYSFHLAG